MINTDTWEQRKFGDIGSIAMCKRIFKEQTSDEGEVPFYKIGTFGVEPDAFISKGGLTNVHNDNQQHYAIL